MDAVDTTLLNAVCTFFLAEAGGIAGEGQRQLLLGGDGVDEFADHGVFAGADEVQILALDLVHHGIHLFKAHHAGHHLGADHERRDVIGEALVNHEIPRIGGHGAVQPGNVPHQVVEALARHAAGGLFVQAIKAHHDIRVVRHLKIGVGLLTELLHFHIFAVVTANRHGGINNVRDFHHPLGQRLAQGCLLLLQRLQLLGLLVDQRLLGLGLLAFALPHEHTDLLAHLVAGGAQLIGTGVYFPLFGVQLQHLVHQRQLFILKFLFDVFLYQLRVFPDQLDIQHDRRPPSFKTPC